MASSLKVNRVVPSTGTNIGLGTANGEIRLASTSKLTFDGDTNTYINHPSSDTISAFTGNVERLRIDSTGILKLYGDNGNNSVIYGHRAGSLTYILGNQSGSNDLNIKTWASSTNIIFSLAGNNEKVRITSAGKVGIGTNDPKQPVSITGRVSIDAKNDYYGVWADGDTAGENHISVGRWYNTGGGLKAGYSQYGINNLILENNHPTAAHTLSLIHI